MTLPSMPRIVRLDLAVVTLPHWHPCAAGWPTIPAYGYVIDHPDGVILFDTGVGMDNAFLSEVYAPVCHPIDDLLDAAGVDPTAVVAVVNSHLHFDHCGQNPSFHGSDVAFFSQAVEFDAVEADPYYTDPAWALAPPSQRRPLAGDEEIADGVRVLATPGHTAGHQSLLIEVGDERIVVGGQIVWDGDEYDAEEARDTNIIDEDLRDQAVDSIKRIKALRPRTVHFSHCAARHRADDD